MKIHRLVALTFITNPENKYSVNHIDYNKLNNNLSNLEWATATEQNKHKRKCKKEIQELVSSRPIWRIDKDTNKKLEYYKTIRFASQWVFDNNLTSVKVFNNGNNIKTKISAVAQGKRQTTFGYKWEYCKENENKNKLRKVIKKVASKNQRLLPEFKKEHPDCGNYHSKFSDQYNKLVIESLGGSGDNDLEKEDKIIRKIAKGVTIDK